MTAPVGECVDVSKSGAISAAGCTVLLVSNMTDCATQGATVAASSAGFCASFGDEIQSLSCLA